MIEKVTVRKDELLEALRENRLKHHTVFDAALEGYRQRLITQLEERVTQLHLGRIPDLVISFPVPKNHVKDYDRIIKMIEMHTGDEVELDEQTFASYVMDDWAWKRQWLDTSRSYAVETVSANYGDDSLI